MSNLTDEAAEITALSTSLRETRPIHIDLKPGERLFLNGAVFRVSQRTRLTLLNDASFLTEGHVLQPEDTTTPLRQVYFCAQVILMNPTARDEAKAAFCRLAEKTRDCLSDASLVRGLDEACALVERGRIVAALKILRGLFAREDAILTTGSDATPISS